jgi:hypothetical protein
MSIDLTAQTAPAAGSADERRVRDLVQTAQRDLSLLVRKEVELAKAELASAAQKGAVGGAALAAAGVFLFFAMVAAVMAFGFGLAFEAGFAVWTAFGIVALVLVALAVGAAAVGGLALRKLRAPTSAVAGARADLAAARGKRAA